MNNTKKQQAVYVAKQPIVQLQQNLTKDHAVFATKKSDMNCNILPAPLERSDDSGAQTQQITPIILNVSINDKVNGGMEILQEETFVNKNGDTNKGGLPHGLSESAKAQLSGHRLDHTTATTKDSTQVGPLITVTSEEQVETLLRRKAINNHHPMESTFWQK